MDRKIKLIGTVLGVVLFIFLVAGFTYAYLEVRTEKTLTTGSGKLSIDYAIVQDIESSALSPSTSKSGGLHGQVKAKLSTGSVPGMFNLYITPSAISSGLTSNEVLKYEVYKNENNTSSLIKSGNFKNATVGTSINIANSKLSDSSKYTFFDIYIWLDNSLVTSSSVINQSFSAEISADSTNITGEFD